jgi:hypothetical protein
MRRQARSSTRITGRRELHDLGSPCLHCFQPPSSRQATTNRASRDYAEALPAPGRAACPVSRTQVRSVSWLTPRPLATDAYVPSGLAWYSATASARNSGEYFDVPNGNSCSSDPHDPMIRVSTIKG